MIDNRPAGPGARLLRVLLLCLVVCLVLAPAPCQEPAAPTPKVEGTPTHGTEPSTWLLLATGLAIILLFRHQQQRRRKPTKPQPMTSGQPRAPAASPSSR